MMKSEGARRTVTLMTENLIFSTVGKWLKIRFSIKIFNSENWHS